MSAQSPIRTVAEQLAFLMGIDPNTARGRMQVLPAPARSVAEQLAILAPDASTPDLLSARREEMAARLASAYGQVGTAAGDQASRDEPAEDSLGTLQVAVNTGIGAARNSRREDGEHRGDSHTGDGQPGARSRATYVEREMRDASRVCADFHR
jgi:hypothetical protein